MPRRSAFAVVITILSTLTFAAAGVTSQQFGQVAELTGSYPTPIFDMGDSVAASGDTIVVGAPGTEVGSNHAQGAVFVYVKPATGWANMTQTAVLTSSDGTSGDYFGISVAISGDTIVVGAYLHNQGEGEAYVFVKPAGGWTDMTETAKLTTTDQLPYATFGASIATDGDTVVVGAPSDIYIGPLPCRVYVYSKPAAGWADTTETAEFYANGANHGNGYGHSVAVGGNAIVVAEVQGFTGINSGNYLYLRPAGGWKSSNVASATLGSSTSTCCLTVAMSPNAVIGIGNNDAVFVYLKPESGWTTATENAQLTGAGSAFFSAPAIDSNSSTIAAASLNFGFSGPLFLYSEPADGWTSTSTANASFLPTDLGTNTNFGISVGLSSTGAVVGDSFATVNGQGFTGKAYVFGPQ
jgi:FG-GAP repeat